MDAAELGRVRRARSTTPGARSRTAGSCWPATCPPRAGPGRTSAARPCRSPSWPRSTEPLVAVHGQSDQHRLLQPARPARGAGPLRRRAAWPRPWPRTPTLYDRLEAAERELDEVVASARERAREADLLRFGLGEVEAVDPEPGEDVALRGRGGPARLRRHAADRRRGGPGGAVERAAGPRTHWRRGGRPDRAGRGARARRRGRRAGRPAGRDHLSALRRGRRRGVVRLAVETDPARLAAVSERRAALTALTRKYGETIDEVLAWAPTGPAAARAGRHRRAHRGAAAPSSAASRAGRARRRRCPSRSHRGGGAARREVTAELALLAMPDARRRVVLQPWPTPAPVVEAELRVGGPVASARRVGRRRGRAAARRQPRRRARDRCTRAPPAASCPG